MLPSVVQWPYMKERTVTITQRQRNRRLEIRTTDDERSLIDQAVAASDTDLTSFVTEHLTLAAQRVLADRDHFVLSTKDARVWDALNEAPARDLRGLRVLMKRPSPFAAE